MGKVFVAKIEYEYQVDKNNYLEWEDEFESEDDGIEPRTLANLLSLLKREFANTISMTDITDVVSIGEES